MLGKRHKGRKIFFEQRPYRKHYAHADHRCGGWGKREDPGGLRPGDSQQTSRMLKAGLG